MKAAAFAAAERAGQLRLDLRTPAASRTRRQPRPYWVSVDLADVGGELHAIRPDARAVIGTERSGDGRWIGYHDLILGIGGSDGRTRPQPCRVDAMVSAAPQLAGYCHSVLARNGSTPRTEARGARHLLEWLEDLDLL